MKLPEKIVQDKRTDRDLLITEEIIPELSNGIIQNQKAFAQQGGGDHHPEERAIEWEKTKNFYN